MESWGARWWPSPRRRRQTHVATKRFRRSHAWGLRREDSFLAVVWWFQGNGCCAASPPCICTFCHLMQHVLLSDCNVPCSDSTKQGYHRDSSKSGDSIGLDASLTATRAIVPLAASLLPSHCLQELPRSAFPGSGFGRLPRSNSFLSRAP